MSAHLYALRNRQDPAGFKESLVRLIDCFGLIHFPDKNKLIRVFVNPERGARDGVKVVIGARPLALEPGQTCLAGSALRAAAGQASLIVGR